MALSFQLSLAARYLAGRKLRSVLTTLAIVFGVAVFFGLGLVGPTMRDAIQRTLASSAGSVDLTITHVTGGTFDASVVDTVRGTPGIQTATGVLERTVIVPNGPVGTVSVVGADPASLRLILPVVTTTAGRLITANDRGAAMVSDALARDLGAGVGGTVTLPSYSGTTAYQIVGIVAYPRAQVFLTLAGAQEMVGQPGKINAILAAFAGGADRDAVTAAVASRLGRDYTVGNADPASAFQTTLQLTEAMYSILGLLALLTAAFIIYNTFRTIVSERRRDIAMLRAVGASRRAILAMTLAESLVQGVVGTALGLVLGYAIGAGGLRAVAAYVGQIVVIEFTLPAISAGALVSAVALGIGMTLAGALLPALAATRVAPLEALRPLATPVSRWALGRRAIAGIALAVGGGAAVATGAAAAVAAGTVAFLVGLLLLAPAAIHPIALTFGRLLRIAFAQEGHLAASNLAREPGRAAITASTLMIGLAIGVAVIGLLSSIATGFQGYLDRTLGADYIVLPRSLLLSGGNQGAGPELRQRIAATPGIAAASSLRIAQSASASGPLQVIGIDPAVFPKVGGLDFTEGDPAQAYTALSRGNAVVLNPILALQMRARLGDDVALKTPEGDRTFRVAGIGVDYINAKLATAYVSQAELAADFHETADVLLMANAAPGADRDRLYAALEGIVGAYPALTLYDSHSLRAVQTRILDAVVRGINVLLLVFAIPGLIAMINTLVIGVIERTRELGMLRAIGTTRGQVRRLILGESVLLASVGVAFGIVAGLWLGYVLVLATSVVFPTTWSFPAGGVLATVAVGLTFGVFAALLPARQAARMPIVAALRYE